MQVVIGTRTWLGPEWTHVDINPAPLTASDGSVHPVDVICDARNIHLPDRCADLVYSQECLEHFKRDEWESVLAEWVRLVAPGGKIRVEVPDFLAACQQVINTDTWEMDHAIQQIVFGGQANQWDIHYVGLTPRMLSRRFEELNLTVTDVKRGWEHGWLMVEAERG